MTAQILPDLVVRLLDADGSPVSGGTATFYQSGTTTVATVYADANLSVALQNPLTTNAAGLLVNASNQPTAVYFDPALDYRLIFRDANGATIRDIDPANPSNLSQQVTAAAAAQAGAEDARDEAQAAQAAAEAALDVVNAAGVVQTTNIASAGAVQLTNIAAAAAQPTIGIFTSEDDGVSNGVIGATAIVAGSGGTNGTFDLAFTGGGGTGAAGRFTVSGGALTSVIITAPGINYTSAPALSFTASSGLTGASATAQIGPRTNDGEYYLLKGSGETFATLYQNSSGSPVSTGLVMLSRPLTRSFDTRAEAMAAGLIYPGDVFIRYDEDYSNLSTHNYFDGWELLTVSVMPFSPQSLFANGEKGAIYDPSDLTAQWQDRTFATPVTTSGQTVGGALDKKVTRPNTTVAQRNIVTASEDYRIAWTTVRSTFYTLSNGWIPDGHEVCWRIAELAVTDYHALSASWTATAADWVMSVPFKAGERDKVSLSLNGAVSGPTAFANFDLTTGTIISQTGCTAGIAPINDGGYLCWVTALMTAGAKTRAIRLLDATGTANYAGIHEDGLYAGGVQLELGTTPSAYQPVGSSGGGWFGGNVLSAPADDGTRPTYVVEDGKPRWRFNGVNQSLYARGTDFTGASVLTYAIALRHTVDNPAGVVMSHGESSGGWFTSTGARELLLNYPADDAISAGFGIGSNWRVAAMYPVAPIPGDEVIVVQMDPDAATEAGKCRMWYNGVELDVGMYAKSGTPTDAVISDIATFALGSRSNLSTFAACDIYYALAINRALTDTERGNLIAWMGDKAGASVSLAPVSYTDTPTAFTDSAAVTDQGSHYETSSWARAVYDTDATVMWVHSWNNIYGTYPQYTSLGVIVDGAYYGSVTPTLAGDARGLVLLPEGSKRVEIVNGLTSKPASTLIGTYLTSIEADAPLTRVMPADTGGLIFYGDSITVGADALPPMRDAAMALVRAAAPEPVGMEAYGWRSLYDDCADAIKRAAFVAKIVARNPGKLWLAIGTNDYGLNKWSAASFGAAYAALMDDLHAALPGLAIFAQSPLIRSTETANGSGSTTDDYRDQVLAAATGRAWVTYVDGKSILTTAVLSDGIHPTSAGHATWAAAIIAELGY